MRHVVPLTGPRRRPSPRLVRIIVGWTVAALVLAVVTVQLILFTGARSEVRADLSYLHEIEMVWGDMAASIADSFLRAVATAGTSGEPTAVRGVRPLVIDFHHSLEGLRQRPWIGELIGSDRSIREAYLYTTHSWSQLKRELLVVSMLSPQEFRYDDLALARASGESFSSGLEMLSRRVNIAADQHAATLERLHWVLFVVVVLLSVAAAVQARVLSVRGRMESRVRRVVRSTLDAQENERQHVAALLREEVAQALSAARITMAQRKACEGSLCSRADDYLQRALSRVQQVSESLESAVHADFGLVRAVDHACRDAASRHNVHVSFESKSGGESALATHAVVHTVRLVQSSLEILVRHAGSRRILVSHERHGDTDEIYIHDDGTSLRPDNDSSTLAVAIEALHERATVVGGSVALRRRSSTTGRTSRRGGWRIAIAVEPAESVHAAHA